MNIGDVIVGCLLVTLSALVGKAVVERDRKQMEARIDKRYAEESK